MGSKGSEAAAAVQSFVPIHGKEGLSGEISKEGAVILDFEL